MSQRTRRFSLDGINMTTLIDLNTEFGAHAAQRLQDELVIWLTTVGLDAMPQPRPVWFIWENDSFVILSKPTSYKLKHIEQHPKVALNFDGGKEGDDIVVFLGQAVIEPDVLSQPLLDQYLAKYAQQIINIGYTNDTFLNAYSVVIRVTPTKVRDIA
jgi:PPOX class probable F420-dependent enzyme